MEWRAKINPYKPVNRELYAVMEEKYDQYKILSNFSLFVDIILPNEEAKRYTKFKMVAFEIDNWCNYCFQVNKFFRPECSDKFSIKRYKRLTRQITNDVILILQYDENLLRKALESDRLDLPNLSLILLIRKDNVGKRDSLNNYTQIVLRDAHNDFFETPVPPPDKLLNKIMSIRLANGIGKAVDLIKRQKIDDSHTRLYHECAIEDDLKFQAFYYLDLESYFSKIYIKFIEDCILKIEGK